MRVCVSCWVVCDCCRVRVLKSMSRHNIRSHHPNQMGRPQRMEKRWVKEKYVKERWVKERCVKERLVK